MNNKKYEEINNSKIKRKSNHETIVDFAEEQKPFLRRGGNFPDDMYDMQIIEFYSLLAEYTWLDDPNLSIEKNMKDLLKTPSLRFGYLESLDNYLSLFPESFIEKIRKWIIMHFEEFFLRNLKKNRTKFTPSSLEKLIDTGVKVILGAGKSPEIWSIEEMISYFKPVIAWTEKASLFLLFDVLATNVSPSSYVKLTHYYNLLYWLDPSANISIEALNDDEFFLELIPNILKKHCIPKDIFSDELLSKIKKFVNEFTPINKELFKPSLREFYPKFKLEWRNTIYQLFLYYIYYGFVNGSIPGIKQNAYSAQVLEIELDQLYNYKPKNETID